MPTGLRGPAALHSAKTALAALAALGFSLLVGVAVPTWAMTTVYITSSPLAGATRSKAVYRVLGTLLGAAFAVAVVPAFQPAPLVLSLILSGWVGACLAVSLLDRTPRAYVLMLAGYTAALVGFPSVNRPDLVFDTASARVTEIVVGITCVTLAHSLIFPVSVGTALAARLDAWLGDAEIWFAEAIGGAPADPDRRRLATDAVDCLLLARHVPYDTSHWREATRTLEALLARMLMLLPLLSGLADRSRVLGDDPSLARARGAMTGWLRAGRPADPLPFADLSIEATSGQALDWRDLLRESYLVRLTQAAAVLAEARLLLTALNTPAHAPPIAPTHIPITLALHRDPTQAVLSGLAAMAGLGAVCLVWIVSGWPDGAGAAALTAVFCCLFAALDNPVPMILRFGGALVASVPLAAVYIFAILPQIDGFAQLALVLFPALFVVGLWTTDARFGLPATAFLVGFGTNLGIQESYQADFAQFLNGACGVLVAVVASAGITAALRVSNADQAIARMLRLMRANLAALARTTVAPDPIATLSRSVDQLALITQRLGAPGASGEAALIGLRSVRLTGNVATLQALRPLADPPLHAALDALLAGLAQHFGGTPVGTAPPPALVAAIDAALRCALGPSDTRPAGVTGPIDGQPATARAALVALRRNLFPDAPDFHIGAEGPEMPA